MKKKIRIPKIAREVLSLFKAGHAMKTIGRSMEKSETWVQNIIRRYGTFYRW